MTKKRLKFFSVAALLLPIALLLSACHVGPHGHREMWVNNDVLYEASKTTAAYAEVKNYADTARPDDGCLIGQDSRHHIWTYANAVVYAATGDNAYAFKAVDGIDDVIGQHTVQAASDEDCSGQGRTLEIGRNGILYVLAADMINLPTYASSTNASFVSWLGTLENHQFPDSPTGGTLRNTFEHRPDNWAHAGALQLAIDVYQGDSTGWHRINQQFNRFTGNLTIPHPDGTEFDYGGGHDWSTEAACRAGTSNFSSCRGINTPGTVNGVNADGFIIRDVDRGGDPADASNGCPDTTDYFAGGYGAYLIILQILERLHDSGNLTGSYAGDPEGYTFNAMGRAAAALERLYDNCGYEWWNRVSDPGNSDDAWSRNLTNYIYGDGMVAENSTSGIGKVMAFTAFTH